MTFSIPEYRHKWLDGFSVCARVENPKAPLPPKRRVAYASVDLPDRRSLWVRVIANKQSSPAGVHVHVDTSLRQFEDDRGAEKNRVANVQAAFAVIAAYANSEVHALPESRFVVPAIALPEHGIIAALLNVSSGRDDGIKLVGSKFSVGRGPVSAIEWHVDRKSDKSTPKIVVHVFAESRTTLHEKYLEDCLRPMTDAFDAFILQGVSQ